MKKNSTITLIGLTVMGLMMPQSSLSAPGALAFKQDPINNLHWFPYLSVLAVLCVVLFFLAKKSKGLIKTNPQYQIIEKMHIHHKTKAYVIEYQGQRFLITDNQNALAIHPLQQENPSL